MISNVSVISNLSLISNVRIISTFFTKLLQLSIISSSSDVNELQVREVTSTSTKCNPCPIGGECPGGNVVYSKSGYWKATATRRDSMVRAIVYQCPPGFCSGGQNSSQTCNDDRVDPVLSTCIYVFVLYISLNKN